ncbi:MAG TPA: septum formation initiator family protein [Candidatus Paceibacterota bacterium]|nr:septum formation initiator family protein [Candidatus Paceibacterota bacterium]
MGIGYQQYRKQLWHVRALLVLVLGLCILVGWSAVTRWQVEREMAARRAAVEAEQAALEARYQDLKADVTYLSDERSLEAEVRKHFDVAKAGESVVIIVDEERGAVAGAATSSFVEAEPPPWWQFWRVW